MGNQEEEEEKEMRRRNRNGGEEEEEEVGEMINYGTLSITVTVYCIQHVQLQRHCARDWTQVCVAFFLHHRGCLLKYLGNRV